MHCSNSEKVKLANSTAQPMWYEFHAWLRFQPKMIDKRSYKPMEQTFRYASIDPNRTHIEHAQLDAKKTKERNQTARNYCSHTNLPA